MKFKIKNTSVSLSFTFFGVFLILLCIGELKICLFSLVASLLHETIHIILIVISGGNVSKITLTAFGANIVRGERTLPDFKEAIISLSAPLFNLILALIFSNKMPYFATVNLVMGLFNLLPYYDFDGGRGLGYILKYFISTKKINALLDVLSATVTALFTFFGVYIFFSYKRNITFILLGIYMIIRFFIRLKPNVNKSYKC